jgi:hypothetical protein
MIHQMGLFFNLKHWPENLKTAEVCESATALKMDIA